MIKIVCDTCGFEEKTRRMSLPPRWTCKPIYEEGRYAGQMSDLCPKCRAASSAPEEIAKSKAAAAPRQPKKVDARQGSLF